MNSEAVSNRFSLNEETPNRCGRMVKGKWSVEDIPGSGVVKGTDIDRGVDALLLGDENNIYVEALQITAGPFT